jgi:hypothetical protein
VIGALLFGALTHLVWDNFTHENAHAVRAIPMLGFDGPDFIGHPMRLYRWLQLVSSIVGLIIVLAGLALWLRHTPRPVEPLPRRAAGPRAHGAVERAVLRAAAADGSVRGNGVSGVGTCRSRANGCWLALR